MAETHDPHGEPADPNAAPMRLEIQERFTNVQVIFCVALAAIAILGGVIAGLTITNS